MILRIALFLTLLIVRSVPAAVAEPLWVEQDATSGPQVHLYVFWSERCPHCREALPFVEGLASEYAWLRVHTYELSASLDNAERYRAMAEALGEEARYVPGFFVCGRMLVGYDSPQGRGQELRDLALGCRTGRVALLSAPEAMPLGEEPLRLPWVGEVRPEAVDLPLFTLVVAGLDAFNPCAFFVLLFLLSLVIHARSRARMLLVGGIFVLISGLVYFLFMAAWLNLFLVVGSTPLVTALAGVVALLIGALNTKDFFLFRQGPTLSIPEGAKPGLFLRMRALVAADSLVTLLAGTVALAVVANSYELLCTAGFPMLYTRALTLRALTPAEHYAYLALYNLIYVLPLLAIVGAFTLTLGARRLTERQGRLLKLLSGSMMLELGAVLLLWPERMTELWVGIALLALALVLTGIGRWWLSQGDGGGQGGRGATS